MEAKLCTCTPGEAPNAPRTVPGQEALEVLGHPHPLPPFSLVGSNLILFPHLTLSLEGQFSCRSIGRIQAMLRSVDSTQVKMVPKVVGHGDSCLLPDRIDLSDCKVSQDRLAAARGKGEVIA